MARADASYFEHGTMADLMRRTSVITRRYARLVLLGGAVLALSVGAAMGAVAQLVDHGGTVLTNPQVTAIYLGDYWSTRQGNADALHTDAFLGAWIAGPSVTGVLAQYGVVAGSYVGSEKVARAAPLSFTDADAQALVQQEIAAGRVLRDDQMVYLVYLPPGTILMFLGASSQNKLGAYHSSYRDAVTGTLVYYVVVVYGQGTNGIDFNGNPQDNLSIITSAALASAITDPDLGRGTPGWRDDVHGDVGEVAFSLSTDAGLGDVWVVQDGFAVALLWSNKDATLQAGTIASVTIGQNETASSVLSITPASQTAAPGATASYTVASASTASENLTLTVSGLPENVTGSFAQSSIAPGGSTTLTLTVGATAATATTTFTVTGTGTASTETATASLTVSTTAAAPAPAAVADFSLSVTPTSQGMKIGGEVVTFTVSSQAIASPGPVIELRALHIRRGIKAYLSSRKITAGESATVTIMAHRDARRGLYEFTLKGSSDQHDARITLTVTVTR